MDHAVAAVADQESASSMSLPQKLALLHHHLDVLLELLVFYALYLAMQRLTTPDGRPSNTTTNTSPLLALHSALLPAGSAGRKRLDASLAWVNGLFLHDDDDSNLLSISGDREEEEDRPPLSKATARTTTTTTTTITYPNITTTTKSPSACSADAEVDAAWAVGSRPSATVARPGLRKRSDTNYGAVYEDHDVPDTLKYAAFRREIFDTPATPSEWLWQQYKLTAASRRRGRSRRVATA